MEACHDRGKQHFKGKTSLGLAALVVPQSRFGGKLLEIRLVYPQNGTAVLTGLKAISLNVHECSTALLEIHLGFENVRRRFAVFAFPQK